MTKSKNNRPTPDQLAKVGKRTGVELTEDQLRQASGGAAPLKIKLVPAV